MTLIAFVFLKLQTAKDVVRELSKRPRFRRPFDKLHGKRSQILWKPEGQDVYCIYWSLWRQLSRKNSLVVTWKILGLFINTLTADNKYYFISRDNLTQPVQMHLSKEQKICPKVFFCIFGNLDEMLEFFK